MPRTPKFTAKSAAKALAETTTAVATASGDLGVGGSITVRASGGATRGSRTKRIRTEAIASSSASNTDNLGSCAQFTGGTLTGGGASTGGLFSAVFATNPFDDSPITTATPSPTTTAPPLPLSQTLPQMVMHHHHQHTQQQQMMMQQHQQQRGMSPMQPTHLSQPPHHHQHHQQQPLPTLHHQHLNQQQQSHIVDIHHGPPPPPSPYHPQHHHPQHPQYMHDPTSIPSMQQQIQNHQNLAYICGECHQQIQNGEPSILCDAGCQFFYHRDCSGLTELACELLNKEAFAEWACHKCIERNGQVPIIKCKKPTHQINTVVPPPHQLPSRQQQQTLPLPPPPPQQQQALIMGYGQPFPSPYQGQQQQMIQSSSGTANNEWTVPTENPSSAYGSVYSQVDPHGTNAGASYSDYSSTIMSASSAAYGQTPPPSIGPQSTDTVGSHLTTGRSQMTTIAPEETSLPAADPYAIDANTFSDFNETPSSVGTKNSGSSGNFSNKKATKGRPRKLKAAAVGDASGPLTDIPGQVAAQKRQRKPRTPRAPKQPKNDHDVIEGNFVKIFAKNASKDLNTDQVAPGQKDKKSKTVASLAGDSASTQGRTISSETPPHRIDNFDFNSNTDENHSNLTPSSVSLVQGQPKSGVGLDIDLDFSDSKNCLSVSNPASKLAHDEDLNGVTDQALVDLGQGRTDFESMGIESSGNLSDDLENINAENFDTLEETHQIQDHLNSSMQNSHSKHIVSQADVQISVPNLNLNSVNENHNKKVVHNTSDAEENIDQNNELSGAPDQSYQKVEMERRQLSSIIDSVKIGKFKVNVAHQDKTCKPSENYVKQNTDETGTASVDKIIQNQEPTQSCSGDPANLILRDSEKTVLDETSTNLAPIQTKTVAELAAGSAQSTLNKNRNEKSSSNNSSSSNNNQETKTAKSTLNSSSNGSTRDQIREQLVNSGSKCANRFTSSNKNFNSNDTDQHTLNIVKIANTQPKLDVDHANNNKEKEQKKCSPKQGGHASRRGSADKKESFREGLMREHDFVIAYQDLGNKKPFLWRIEAKNIIQKFEPVEVGDVIMHQETSIYQAWDHRTPYKNHTGVNVRITQQNSRTKPSMVELIDIVSVASNKNHLHINNKKTNKPSTQCSTLDNDDQSSTSPGQLYWNNFQVYIQSLLSIALDRGLDLMARQRAIMINDKSADTDTIASGEKNTKEPLLPFWQDIEKDQNPYFLNNVRAIDDVLDREKAKILSKLSPDQYVCSFLDTYPHIRFERIVDQEQQCNNNTKNQDNNIKKSRCRVCNTNWSTQLMHFDAQTKYDPSTFDLIVEDVDGNGAVCINAGNDTSNTNSNNNSSNGPTPTNSNEHSLHVCRQCMECLALYSELHHFKWKFFLKSTEKLMPFLQDVNPERHSNDILDLCFEDESWMSKIRDEFESLFERIERND